MVSSHFCPNEMINLLPFRQFLPSVTPCNQSEMHNGATGKGMLSHSVTSWHWSEPRGIQSSHQLLAELLLFALNY